MFERQRLHLEASAQGEAEAGFTLIELLIVIVVLGILAAVVIFGLSGLTGQSAQSACNADAKTTEIAVEAYHAQAGQWPATFTDLTAPTFPGVPVGERFLRTAPSNPNHYVLAIAASGVVNVTPLNGSGAALSPALAAGAGPFNYDATAPLNGAGTSSNPCSYVQ